ncbi:MAG: DUF2207 domain-containing protein [Tissierellia bacterium]|nr:DUF2207 domain-containing protein [Tissierellia bacterium]
MSTIKRWFKTTLFLLVVLILFTFPLKARAEEDLIITRWLVDAEILKNGDLQVVEDISFRFNRHFNGVFREILLHETDGVENVKVVELIRGNEKEYIQVDKAEKGDRDVFLVIDKGEFIYIQIFSPAKDEEKTFRLKYIVKNVAVKYKDTAELYYKFLGEENETQINYFSANIKLPGNITENTKIFAHGSVEGSIHFSGDNAVKAEAEHIPKNTFVEVRILFPTEYIPASSNIVDKDAYDEIIEEETAYIEEIREREAKKAARKEAFNNISLMSSGILALIFFLVFNKFRRRPDIFERLDNKIYPDDNSPAIVSYVLNSYHHPTAFVATILDLARRSFIRIEDLGKGKKSHHFKLIREKEATNELLDHERYLLTWLFDEMGDGRTISSTEIEFYRKMQGMKFYKGHTEWTKLVSKEAKEMGYYDNSTKKISVLLLIISTLFFALSIISMVFEAFYGILLLALATIIFIYALVLITRKSDYGYIQVKKWKDFKRDLEKRSKSLNIDDLWLSLDKALIYGLALGIPFTSLKRFKKFYPQSHSPSYWPYWFFLTNSRGENAFGSSINKSFNNTSSSLGGGGGFSAGGGGGAGGGGAGGF